MTHVTDEQLGKISRQWADVFRRVREGTIEPEYVSSNLQRIIEQKLPAHESTVFTLKVNYGQSVEKALKAGDYDWADENFTSRNFPPTRRGTDTVELHLIRFNKVMTSDAVIKKLDTQGLRPATIEELLAFGVNPETRNLQRQFKIIALASVWQNSNGRRNVPVLCKLACGRVADLLWFGFEWLSLYRFLAVSK